MLPIWYDIGELIELWCETKYDFIMNRRIILEEFLEFNVSEYVIRHIFYIYIGILTRNKKRKDC